MAERGGGAGGVFVGHDGEGLFRGRHVMGEEGGAEGLEEDALGAVAHRVGEGVVGEGVGEGGELAAEGHSKIPNRGLKSTEAGSSRQNFLHFFPFRARVLLEK